MAPNPLLRIRPHAKKTFGDAFGEAFGAATGFSDPRRQKIRIRNRRRKPHTQIHHHVSSKGRAIFIL
jgi:hypothetical protein